ncbi:MAG: hypothetical protein ABW110_07250, partial [Steroidobacteraceae bacterium]
MGDGAQCEPGLVSHRWAMNPRSSRHFQRDCNCMTKIYVGNLPFSADEGQVRSLFEQHGTVESVALINDR